MSHSSARQFGGWVGASVIVLCALGAARSVCAQTSGTLRLEALIDTRSQLIVRGNTAHWFHLEGAAPGRHEGVNDPTVINGDAWFPVWPGGRGENRFCECDSSVFDCIEPPLPLAEMSVTLRHIEDRNGNASSIVQEPTVANDFTLIVQFDDGEIGGSSPFILEIDYDSASNSLPNLGPFCPDCNRNGMDDAVDLGDGTSQDCDVNGAPDECQADCDGDTVADACVLLSGAADCNFDSIPDSCQLDGSTDCNNNGVLDECELPAGDCNGNGVPDECDISSGSEMDCNANGVPDSCDVEAFVQGPRSTFDSGLNPLGITAVNLDQDPGLEIVTANRDSDDISVHSNTGDGRIRRTTQFAVTGEEPVSLSAGDIDGDTVSDVVTANRATNDISVFWGDGMGGFGAVDTLGAGDSPVSLTIALLDGDALSDIVAANRDDATLSVLLHTGPRTFVPAASLALPAGAQPHGVVVADLDGAGGLDVVSTDRSAGATEIQIFFGVGDGTFSAATPVTAVSRPLSVAAAFIDNDTNVDLVVTSFFSTAVGVLINTSGAGTFNAPVEITAPGRDAFPLGGDVDDDGDEDLVTSGRFGRSYRVFFNDGSGGFGSTEDFTLDRPAEVVTADLSGNGKLDLALTLDRSDQIAVYLNLTNEVTDDDGNGTPDDCEEGGVGLVPGDVNVDSSLNIADPVSMLNFLFGATAFSPCLMTGPGQLNDVGLNLANWNGDPSVNIADPVGALNFLFGNGVPHALAGDDNCTIQDSTCDEGCL